MSERAYDRDPTQSMGGGFLGMEGHPDSATIVPGIGEEQWNEAGQTRSHRIGGPQYTSQHKWLLSNLPTESLVRIQETLEAVGFTKKMKIGALDDATLDNWVELLGIANRQGETWDVTLSKLGEQAAAGLKGDEDEDELPEFTADTYVPQDPVAMAEQVRKLMRQQLKREPKPHEIDELVEELGGLGRLAHEQEQELAEMRFNAERRGEGEVPGEHEVIDPSARFRKSFEERYGGEIEHLEDVEEVAGQREALQGNVAATDRYVRG